MVTESAIEISYLRASLNGKAISSGDRDYEDVRRVFFTGFDREPAAIVRVSNASDVARVVTLARESGAELAVRSGGTAERGMVRPRAALSSTFLR